MDMDLKKILNSFSKIKIGVIGDIVADRFVYGVPERLSREAPVAIIQYESEELFPGCAGNTIRNLADLGASVYPVSALGEDPWATEILAFFQGGKICTDHILQVSQGRTVAKTRILAGDFHTKKQQVVRIDRGRGLEIGEGEKEKIFHSISALSPSLDGWIVSDYGYQLVGPEVRNLMAQWAEQIPIIVDSRKNIQFFRNATLLTPNEEEAEKASKIQIRSREDAQKAAEKLLEMTGAKGVLITRGNQGMCLLEREKPARVLPCYGSLHIADVTGAGDTVTSVAALALATGGTPFEAAQLATYAASVVVMKMGTATCSKEELGEILQSVKYTDLR